MKHCPSGSEIGRCVGLTAVFIVVGVTVIFILDLLGDWILLGEEDWGELLVFDAGDANSSVSFRTVSLGVPWFWQSK